MDVVVNTHLHFAHVNWNTLRTKDSWTPTFHNARYPIPEADYRHFGLEGLAQATAHRGAWRRAAVVPPTIGAITLPGRRSR
ncbi:hypothetical protein QGN32_12835 [Mycolicibacterium sp. ND9-15]|uniref:hypothetical protein n=1 Tax=Mycolicibacterium sp. ND9-15 TaxID=3042320 RepID=UPI002DDB0EB2|nr:hypothetical protein [Mycolicibacterium sp. ND9-15]WSE54419.1 hypothetical protein QGN32_12835 [Mycolicibacterium sp. ND9-15]